MRPVAVSDEEQRWKRRSDARTLAEAEEIKADKKRFAEAKIGAKELLEERENENKGLKKVAHNKCIKTKEVKPTGKGRYTNPATIRTF